MSSYDAVVVGAGPTGLAAALLLRERGARVAVVEREADPARFDPERAEVCLVDGRGGVVFEQLGLCSQLAAVGVAQRDLRTASVTAQEGVSAPSRLPTVRLEPTQPADARAGAYWIPREALVGIFDQAVAATAPAADDPRRPPIVRLYGRELGALALASAETGWALNLTAAAGARGADGGGDADDGGDSQTEQVIAKLVIGTDGMRSAVRETLRAVARAGGLGDSFSVVSRRAASAGLRQKLLKLPPSFALSPDGATMPERDVSYAIVSATGVAPELRLWMLPQARGERGRTAQLITGADHLIWARRTADDAARFLADAFPHVPIGPAQVGEDEMRRFAESAGTLLPNPQHCTHAALTCGALVGAALAGDALHAFPPDLGQGVNAGLQDVAALASCLDDHGVTFRAQPPAAPSDVGAQAARRPDALACALARYGISRAKEAAALTKLVQLGHPLQYSQAVPFGAIRRAAWRANFGARLALARTLGPRLNFFPSVFALVQNPRLSYSEVLRLAHATTRSMLVLAALSALVLAGAHRLALAAVAGM